MDESKIEGIPQGAFMGDDIRADLAALQKQKEDAEKAAEEAAARRLRRRWIWRLRY